MRTHIETARNRNLRKPGKERPFLRELAREPGLPHGTLHDEILRALRRILRRVKTIRIVNRVKTIRIVRITTDNGSEFLDHEAPEALLPARPPPIACPSPWMQRDRTKHCCFSFFCLPSLSPSAIIPP